MNLQRVVWTLLRLVMSFTFLWAFFDKVFGLGFATVSEKAWIHGGSPTTGFLMNATKGPFAEMFKSLAGNQLVDWVFMLGLLFVGLTLLLNKYVKWGTLVGVVMLALMYLALLWPENNPLIDEHIVYILVLCLLGFNSNQN